MGRDLKKAEEFSQSTGQTLANERAGSNGNDLRLNLEKALARLMESRQNAACWRVGPGPSLAHSLAGSSLGSA